MKQEDINFLKDLQHELNTQDNYGQADPYYWGIMERKTVPAVDDCGDEVRFFMIDECDGDFTQEELIEYIQSDYYDEWDDDMKEEWDEMISDDPIPWEISHFINHNNIIRGELQYYEVEEKDVLSQDTGCFLTRRAAQEYIDKFGYNHSQPRTYAMTAYRNFEFERLLNILKTIDLNDVEELFNNRRHEFYQKIDRGAIISGVVKKFENDGVVIDFKYCEGFLPSSEIAWNPKIRAWDVMKRGDTINVVVLDYDDDHNMHLGYKQLFPHENEV